MNLRRKISLTYLIIALLVVLGIAVFVGLWIESYWIKQTITKLSEEADFVIFYLKDRKFLDREELYAKIRELSGALRLRITLVDSQGWVVVDSDVPFEKLDSMQNHINRPEISKANSYGIGYDTRRSVTLNNELLYLAKKVSGSKIFFTTKDVQYVRVAFPLQGLASEINYIRTIIAVTGLCVLLIIFIVSLFVSKFVTNPMNRIVGAIKEIRAGNLDARIEVKTEDETALVAKAINELVEKLKSDIVELKKLEKVRSQFLGNVSHELRTPIFSIQGYLETLERGAIDDKSVNRVFLEKARANLERLNALLEDLISISQIESGEMKMSLRYFEVNEFLDSICKEYESVAEKRKVKLSLKLGTSNEDMMYGDRDRLRQVMYNLISNAINYNKENGEVIVASEKTDGEIRISVKDTGIGIPPEHIQRIFERFYRVDTNRSRELGGTGLGLAIVKHIIEAHNTTIEVKSEIGKGSLFSFVLRRG